MVARILALVAAIGMIVGALAYNSGQSDDGSGGAGGGNTGAVVIVCATELGAACSAIANATVEPAAETAERLLEARTLADARIDGWLVAGPWPAMVDAERGRRQLATLFESSSVLASTPLVAVVKRDRMTGACPAEVTWKCIGEAVQAPTFLVGAEGPKATGLFSRAALFGGLHGSLDYSSGDLDESAEGLANLERSIREASSRNATDLLRFLISAPDVAVFLTTGAAAKAAGAPTPIATVAAPLPAARIGAVFAQTGQRAGRAVDEAKVRAALGAAGWDAQPLSAAEGLPSPGVLLYLSQQA